MTVLGGDLELGDWSHEMHSPQAVLMNYGGSVYLVTDGHRSLIDLADRPVTLALGIQAGSVRPAPMSKALFEALIPTAPLRVPAVPNAGGLSATPSAAAGRVGVGSSVRVRRRAAAVLCGLACWHAIDTRDGGVDVEQRGPIRAGTCA